MIINGTSSYEFDKTDTEQLKNFIKTVVLKQLNTTDTPDKFNELNKKFIAEIQKYQAMSQLPNKMWVGIDLGTSTTCVAYSK